MGKQMKKIWAWVTSVAVCVIAAVGLLIILPLVTPTNAVPTQETTPIHDHTHDAEANPGINDKPDKVDPDNNGNNDKDTDSETTGGATTEPPTTDPEPTTPIDPEPPVTEPSFTLTIENLRGTIWYDAKKDRYLTFATDGKTCTIANHKMTLNYDWSITADDSVKLTCKSTEALNSELTLLYTDLKLSNDKYCFVLTTDVD